MEQRAVPTLIDGNVNIIPKALYEITLIADVGNDQGRRVRVRWNAGWDDNEDAGYPIVSYDIFRRVDENLKHSIVPAPGSVEDHVQEQLRYPPGDWDFVKSVPRHPGQPGDSTIWRDPCDSTIVDGTCWSTFFVRAKTSQPTMFFDTPPDSGYSVDNLPPGVPQDLRNEGHQLAWTPNQEDDFSYYSVYASTDAEFDPMTDTLLGRTAESSFALEGVDPVFIHVAATDFAGNQGGAATLAMPSAANDAEQVLRWDLSLVGENPSRDRARIRYEVPRSAHIEVSVYDAAGRYVAVLVDETRPPGRFEATWDGRDVSGRSRCIRRLLLPSACAGRSGDEEDSPDPIAASEGARVAACRQPWAPASPQRIQATDRTPSCNVSGAMSASLGQTRVWLTGSTRNCRKNSTSFSGSKTGPQMRVSRSMSPTTPSRNRRRTRTHPDTWRR